ncbi:hypothetical protein [uncultured Lacinutrix sp.]|uniref:hypothetical protein n=1 Tax=uncultured Lacinutrix sp. TaxID=574032 RepID=UPI00262DA5F7|nr:hypothetical protein [uncultured Lacinutrix sp.]
MSLYKDWGYTSNPFKPSPIEPTLKGLNLLIGREKEKRKLKNRIKNNNGIITVEGQNGIGKTSVINASIYELYEESLSSKENDNFYLPCNKIFQISSKNNLTEFIDDFYFSIAQTIIDKKKEIKESGVKNLKVENLNNWLNSSEVENIKSQISNLGGMPIETSGFAKSGFKKQIRTLLSHIFSNSESSGIVCVLDNLELLETSDDAKRTLEYLRDEIFNIPEIKWFFSGSHNIFRTFISTPRLSGFIQNPLKIQQLPNINASYVLTSRINSYQNHVDNKPYSPITETDFIVLFESLNGNLREVFKRLSNYYSYVFEELDEEPYQKESKSRVFKEWFEQDKNIEFKALKDNLRDSEINLLKLIYLQENNPITDKTLDENNLTSISELVNVISNLEKQGIIIIPILENEYIEQNKYTRRQDFLKNIFISPKAHYIKNKLLD